MTVKTLKDYIEKTIGVLSMIASFTSTKLDDIAVEALRTLALNDALLDLLVKLFTDGDVDVPAELQAEWDNIQPAIRPLKEAITWNGQQL